MVGLRGSLALIAGTNQRISKTDERQRVQCTEYFSAASDRSDYLGNFHELNHENDTRQPLKGTLFYNQNKEIWRRHGEQCKDEASQNGSTHFLSECNKSSMEFECLLTFTELGALSTSHKPTVDFASIENSCNLPIDQYECGCSLCLNKRNAIISSVSKAKHFINQAVHNYCASASAYSDTDNVSQSFQVKYQKCFINLAHLVLVIACLRGII